TAGEAIVRPWLDAVTEVKKGEGDSVVAGARVVSGRLRLMTTWASGERAWARLSAARAPRLDVAAPIARLTRRVLERGTPVAAAVVGAAAFASDGTAAGFL